MSLRILPVAVDFIAVAEGAIFLFEDADEGDVARNEAATPSREGVLGNDAEKRDTRRVRGYFVHVGL